MEKKTEEEPSCGREIPTFWEVRARIPVRIGPTSICYDAVFPPLGACKCVVGASMFVFLGFVLREICSSVVFLFGDSDLLGSGELNAGHEVFDVVTRCSAGRL